MPGVTAPQVSRDRGCVCISPHRHDHVALAPREVDAGGRLVQLGAASRGRASMRVSCSFSHASMPTRACTGAGKTVRPRYVIQRDATHLMAGSELERRARRHVAVVDAVRKRDDVRGEAVPADVRAVPGLQWIARRPARAQPANRVVRNTDRAAVRAHQEDGLRRRCTGGAARSSSAQFLLVLDSPHQTCSWPARASATAQRRAARAHGTRDGQEQPTSAARTLSVSA